ncbi:MAG TPA: RimK family alpha-L-glutamate ligase [Cyclobacteriaceae bacterium]
MKKVKIMKKCAFLTMESLEDFVCYDHLLYEPLSALDWDVTEVPWNKNADWKQFDLVLIRSTWDYQDHPEQFLSVLEGINIQSKLENSLETVKWNLQKDYLQDLQGCGIEIVPTLWENTFNEKKLHDYFNFFNEPELVIKPRISANADRTYRISKAYQKGYLEQLARDFSGSRFMVQPFLPSILDEGEYSLFFFGEQYSHAIVKKPKKDDFRVQEEHGGMLQSIVADQSMIDLSIRILKNIDPLPLYSRIDFVRYQDQLVLIELELIEPSLYFNMDQKSPYLFAKVLNEWYG